MKRFHALIVLVLLSCAPEKKERTANFPRATRASWRGSKENLWVFLMAGQSNMAGRGFVEPQDTIPNSRVFSINASGELIVAKEPFHFYEPKLTGLDCGMAFAKRLVSKLPDSISVLMIPAAIGGSSMKQWLGDSTQRGVKLLSNFREKAAIGKRLGVIKGVLWHQGESDAHPEAINAYGQRLAELVALLRKEAGADSLSFLIGELGSFSRDNRNWQAINAKIAEYCLRDNHASVIATQDLKHKGDTIHFDSKALREMGKRFAETHVSNLVEEGYFKQK